MLKPNLLEAKKRNSKEILVKTNEYILLDNTKTLGINKKYFIKTYGCQMNEHDTENIKAILEDMSFSESTNMEDADLIILNTCAIRENVHNKVFGMIGRINALKQEKPDLIAGICGCMAQEEVVVDKILKTYKWLDFVMGTHNIHNLPQILERAVSNKQIEIEVLSGQGSVLENIPVKRNSLYKAWVNIMYGCDKFCTYCIVPYTRGKQRSRHHQHIIDEVNELVKNNYLEVTLLGQNVNAYGKDLDNNYTMADLLRDVALTNIKRVVFVTSHPWDFTDEMIDVIATYPNIMPYIHLPVQAGSNRILKLMGRKYTREEYITLFDKLKSRIPNVTISTDIIVGFPGESEAEFNETIDLVNYCKFDSAYTFIFSKRAGTPAYNMDDPISLEVKKERLHQLNLIVNKHSLESNNKYINKTIKVLLESSSKKPGYLSGYSEGMKLVNVKAPLEMIGKIVNVEIKKAQSWSMDGILKEE